jgi:signal transduction histidine kinase
MTRQLDLVELLHLLGHELRSPAGVLIGYVRMLQEGRFSSEADRVRIYDKMRASLTRVTGLGDAVSQLTSWIERPERPAVLVDANELLDRSFAAARAAHDRPLETEMHVPPGAARISVKDGQALEAAVAAVIQATAREAGDAPVAVRATVRRDREPAVEVVVGPKARLLAEATAGKDAGPSLSSEGTEEFAIGRGGMGLSLVLATVVLDAHAARVWTAAGNRSIAGVRLPVAAEEQ